MYLDLLTAATGALKSVSDAYNNTGRDRGTGVYFVVMSHTTAEFFRTLTIETRVEHVHESFLNWLQSARLAMTEELELGQPVDSQLARNFVRTSKEFAEELNRYVVSVATEPKA